MKNTRAHLSGTFGFKGKYLFVTENGLFKDGNVKILILLLLPDVYPSQLSPMTSIEGGESVGFQKNNDLLQNSYV